MRNFNCRVLPYLIAVTLISGCATVGSRSEESGTCRVIAGAPSPSKNSLTLERLSPNPNSKVDGDSLLEATLRYSLVDYPGGHYRVIAMFPTHKGGIATDGSFPPQRYAAACGPVGRIKVIMPFRYVWGPDVITHPPRVQFVLIKMGPKIGSLVAATPFYDYTE